MAICVKSTRNKTIKSRKNVFTDSELSTGPFASSNSEGSASTTDSSNYRRRMYKTRNPLGKPELRKTVSSGVEELSAPLDARGSLSTINSDGCGLSESRFCERCDLLMAQVTEMRMHSYDKWVTQIKTLEDMLSNKDALLDQFQVDNVKLQQEVSESSLMVDNLRQELAKLQESLHQTNIQMQQQTSDIAEYQLQNKALLLQLDAEKSKVQKLQEAALHDTKVIKSLRQQLQSK